jgi:hypothetical protein
MSTFGVEHAEQLCRKHRSVPSPWLRYDPGLRVLAGEWRTTSPVLQRVLAVSVAMGEVFSDIYLFSENTHTVCA